MIHVMDHNYLINFRLSCPACDLELASYEKFIEHVSKKHADDPSLRMRARITKEEQK
jgi:uncharacterized C2H2 Zn-finger protein